MFKFKINNKQNSDFCKQKTLVFTLNRKKDTFILFQLLGLTVKIGNYIGQLKTV